MSQESITILGVCILRTNTYWGCESTVLRGSITSIIYVQEYQQKSELIQ